MSQTCSKRWRGRPHRRSCNQRLQSYCGKHDVHRLRGVLRETRRHGGRAWDACACGDDGGVDVGAPVEDFRRKLDV